MVLVIVKTVMGAESSLKHRWASIDLRVGLDLGWHLYVRYLSCLPSSDFCWVRCLSATLSRDQLTESCSVRTCFLHETFIVSKASVSLLYSLPIFRGTFFHHAFSDGDAGEGEPLIGGRGCPGEVLPCDGSALWAVRETAGHERGSGHENALHQLRTAEVSGLPAGMWRQTGCPFEEVTSLLWSLYLRWYCKWSHKMIYFSSVQDFWKEEMVMASLSTRRNSSMIVSGSFPIVKQPCCNSWSKA